MRATQGSWTIGAAARELDIEEEELDQITADLYITVHGEGDQRRISGADLLRLKEFNPRKFWTLASTLRRLRCDEQRIKRLVSEGEIPARRWEDQMKFPKTRESRLDDEDSFDSADEDSLSFGEEEDLPPSKLASKSYWRAVLTITAFIVLVVAIACFVFAGIK